MRAPFRLSTVFLCRHRAGIGSAEKWVGRRFAQRHSVLAFVASTMPAQCQAQNFCETQIMLLDRFAIVRYKGRIAKAKGTEHGFPNFDQ